MFITKNNFSIKSGKNYNYRFFSNQTLIYFDIYQSVQNREAYRDKNLYATSSLLVFPAKP